MTSEHHGFFVPQPQRKKIFREKNPTLGRILQREVVRIYRQLRFIVIAPSYRLQKWHHDRNREERVRFFEGQRVFQEKAFVFVLYQPSGVSETTIETCAMLSDSGYAVVAISNCPLSARDSERLSRVCWKYGTRPNYGYDAGAYRDAVKLLEAHAGTINEILMMNDSIMFPLGGDLNILEDMRRMPDGFGGLVLKTKAPSRKAGRHLWDDFVEAYF